MKEQLIFNKQQLDSFYQYLAAEVDKGPISIRVSSANKQRTLTQNRSIYKYFRMLSDTLNEAGLDMVTVLSEGTRIPWSEDKVKSDIWGKVQLALTGKKSTTELETHEVSEVYDVVNRHLSQTFGVFVPFPSQDDYNTLASRACNPKTQNAD